jgi:hypothetical protein
MESRGSSIRKESPLRLTLTFVLTFSLLAVSPLFGQSAPSADLRASHIAPAEIAVGESFEWTATVENLGPDAAVDVTILNFAAPADGVAGGAQCDQVIPLLEPGASHVITCSVTPHVPPHDWHVFTMASSSSTDDPVEANDRALTPLRVIAPPDIDVWIRTGPPGQALQRERHVDPNLPFDLQLTFSNRAWTDAVNVSVVVEVPRAEGFVDLPDACLAISDQSVQCVIDLVPAKSSVGGFDTTDLTLRALAPDDVTGSMIEGSASVHVPQTGQKLTRTFESTMFRTFYVTRDADSGTGSLRWAIDEVNGMCGDDAPCKIAFRMSPEEGDRWSTIRIENSLPAVEGTHVWIDGTTQTRFFGDSNPLGPEIELNGTLMESGNGLTLSSRCSMELAGLVINGFPGAGVVAAGTDECAYQNAGNNDDQRIIRDSYFGTIPTGMTAAPNVRGIVVSFVSPLNEGLFASPGIVAWQIVDNLISGNERSGIFSISGTQRISGNIIGLNRDVSAGLGNGASGIYTGPRSNGASIENNYIGFNHHFGIAVDRDAKYVSMLANSIQANGQNGIDVGLDGVATATPWFVGVLEPPVITQAKWNPVRHSTVVEGSVDKFDTWPDVISIYANDAPDASGYGEGQYFLGTSEATRDGAFVFHYPEDLRGKWISVTTTHETYVGFAKPVSPSASDRFGRLSATTEFSRSVEVK